MTRPLRLALPIGELDALGIPRGPKFDKILDQLFEMQLRGKGRTPEDRTKLLRQLAGIKEEPKKKPEKEKKKKGKGSETEGKTQQKPAAADQVAAKSTPAQAAHAKAAAPHAAPPKPATTHAPSAKEAHAHAPKSKPAAKKKSR